MGRDTTAMLMERPKKVLRSSAITVLLLAGALLSSMLIQEILAADAAVPSLFILAVFLVALFTDGYIYGIIASLVSVWAVNYAFTAPYFMLSLTIPENLFSAFVMLAVTISTNAITLNAAAAAHFQDVRYVMVGIDREHLQIAVRPLTKRELELKLYPQESMYKLTVGKGYARITNKALVAQIAKELSCSIENGKLPARFDEKEHLLIADVRERGDEG